MVGGALDVVARRDPRRDGASRAAAGKAVESSESGAVPEENTRDVSRERPAERAVPGSGEAAAERGGGSGEAPPEPSRRESDLARAAAALRGGRVGRMGGARRRVRAVARAVPGGLCPTSAEGGRDRKVPEMPLHTRPAFSSSHAVLLPARCAALACNCGAQTPLPRHVRAPCDLATAP